LDPGGFFKNKPPLQILCDIVLSDFFKKLSNSMPIFFKNSKITLPFYYYFDLSSIVLENFKSVDLECYLYL
jgi:hypothetical protein